MITAVADVEVAVSCLSSGAMDYLTKPFHLEEVVVVGGSSYVPVLRHQLDRAVQVWVAETRETYGNPGIRHIRSLPGALEDAALFAVALGTAYPAQSFEEISLGRVPYDTELVLGKERTRTVKLLDAYAPLPAAVTRLPGNRSRAWSSASRRA